MLMCNYVVQRGRFRYAVAQRCKTAITIPGIPGTYIKYHLAHSAE